MRTQDVRAGTAEHRTMKSVAAVILAAGASSRLGELGSHCSKPTLPIAGQPLIGRLIDSLRAAGVGRLVVVGHPSDQRLSAHLRVHHPEVELVMQSERRGTADALRHALPLVASEPAYLACACDALLVPDDVARVQRLGQGRPGTAVVGVLETPAGTAPADDTNLLQVIEAHALSSAPGWPVPTPLYWLPRSLSSYIDTVAPGGGEADIATALNSFIINGGTVHAVRLTNRPAITVEEDIENAEAWLLEQQEKS